MTPENTPKPEKKTKKEPKTKVKSGYKLSEYHNQFICKKIAEENMCGAQIADIFNSVFGKKGQRGGVTITYNTVYRIKDDPKFMPLIHDYKMQYAKTVDKNRYTDLSFCSEVLKEIIDDAKANKKHKEACTALQLLATLNGNIVEKVAVEYSDEELRARIRKEKEKQKTWLIEYKDEEEQEEIEPEIEIITEEELNELESDSQHIIDENTPDGQTLF